MNADWQKWFSFPSKNTDGTVFPDYAAQCVAVRNHSIISPLTAFSLIRVSGDDALTFLHGQLSSDVRELDGKHAQYSSYSSAKGRMLASFLIWKAGEDYFLLLSADIAEAMVKRLSMFIMRSHVKAVLCPDTLLLGLKGVQAEAWLSQHLSALPQSALSQITSENGAVCIRLASGALLLQLDSETTETWHGVFPDGVVAIEPNAWSLLDIMAGIPWVTLSTQEQFVAQMTNMDVIGAVSFTKGCFPGQEIIARTRYLGKVKRRMVRVLLPHAANNGDALYSPAVAEQSIGNLVNVAQDESGQYQALAVAQSACWADGVYLDKENLHKLEKLSLPYVVSDE